MIAFSPVAGLGATAGTMISRLEVFVNHVAKMFMLSSLLILTAPFGEALAKGSVKEGAKQFEKHQCNQCHLGGNNLLEPGKPLKGATFAKKYPNDLQIAAVIRKGVAGTGMAANPPDLLSQDELSDIIAYIRSLTCSTPAPQKKNPK